MFVLSLTVGYGLKDWEAACEVMRDLWPGNVFHSWVIHLHFLWVVTVPYSIYSNSSKCLDSSLQRTKHTQTAWNDVHQSNFVSIRDQVNFVLSLSVTELSRITFLSYNIWKQTCQEVQRNHRKPWSHTFTKTLVLCHFTLLIHFLASLWLFVLPEIFCKKILQIQISEANSV